MSNAKLKRSQAELRARQALMSDARPMVASQHRIVTKRGNVATGSIDVVAPAKVRANRIELTLLSPNATQDERAAWDALIAYRNMEWAKTHNRKG